MKGIPSALPQSLGDDLKVWVEADEKLWTKKYSLEYQKKSSRVGV